MQGKASWKELFVKHTFFTQGYKYYLSVVAASTTEESQLKWSGLVESKVRHLVVKLESHESIAIAHPFNKGFERTHRCTTDAQAVDAKSGNVQYQVKDTSEDTKTPKIDTDAKNEVKNEVKGEVNGEANNEEQKSNSEPQATMVYTTTFYIGLELHPGEWAIVPDQDKLRPQTELQLEDYNWFAHPTHY